MGCSAPKGDASIFPSHFQLPTKKSSCFISGAGLGGPAIGLGAADDAAPPPEAGFFAACCASANEANPHTPTTSAIRFMEPPSGRAIYHDTAGARTTTL